MSSAAPATQAAARPGVAISAPLTSAASDCQASPRQKSSTNDEMSIVAKVEKRWCP